MLCQALKLVPKILITIRYDSFLQLDGLRYILCNNILHLYNILMFMKNFFILFIDHYVVYYRLIDFPYSGPQLRSHETNFPMINADSYWREKPCKRNECGKVFSQNHHLFFFLTCKNLYRREIL